MQYPLIFYFVKAEQTLGYALLEETLMVSHWKSISEKKHTLELKTIHTCYRSILVDTND